MTTKHLVKKINAHISMLQVIAELISLNTPETISTKRLITKIRQHTKEVEEGLREWHA